MSSDLDRLLNFMKGQGAFDVLLYLFFGTIAIVALFLISRLIRNLVAHRVRQVEEFGMDLDSVTNMLDKDLLTPDEAKKVKSVLSRRFQQMYEKRTESEPIDLAAEAERAGGAGPTFADTTGQRPHAQAQPPRPTPSSPAPPSPPTPGASQSDESDDVEIPIDVLDMHNAGMITDEEMEALRRYYASKSK